MSRRAHLKVGAAMLAAAIVAAADGVAQFRSATDRDSR